MTNVRDPILYNEGKVFVVAEAGVNHNGDVGLAKELIEVAKSAGADAVKFQTWKPGEITGKFAYNISYLETGEDPSTRYELSNRLALPYDAFRELHAYCQERDVLFLSTPDGFESLDFLVDELNVPIVKVGSTEITHLAYIEAIAKKNRPILLSTGMSDLGEVERCVNIIQQHSTKDLVLLHCTSEYPAPYEEVNLRAMVTMREAFQLPVGFSDHTSGLEADIAAVALGARVIEKHFTLDKSLPGPDHRASLSPDDLHQLMKSVRLAEELLGDGIKRPTRSEQANLGGIRRGVVAGRNLARGTVLREGDLTAKRPYVGIEPSQAKILLGMTLARDLQEDEPVSWDDVR